MRRRRALAAIPLALAGLLLAPAGGSGHPGHGYAQVDVATLSYQPADISIVVGDGVNWVWRGPDTNHTITADPGQAESFDSDPSGQPAHAVDDSFFHLFQSPGRFTYHCKVHPTMRGTIDVSDLLPPALAGAKVKPAAVCAERGCKQPELRISVNEPATLSGEIERRAKGGWRRARSVPARELDPGPNSVPLRVRGLDAGDYRVTATARDGLGNESAPQQARFEVRRGGSR